MFYKMAALLWYGGGSVAAYFVGRNVVNRVGNYTIDLLLNSNANPDIKDSHIVKSISSLLDNYRQMRSDHPSYNSMLAVRESLNKLQSYIETAELRKEAHKNGYFSRFRNYDATGDNIIIEKLTTEVLDRLEIFSTVQKTLAANPDPL